MTTVKPSTITNETGAYTYKSGISSPTTNYIDNTFPNLLDKTGDNSTNGGGITGRIDFLSGSTLNIDSGSTVNINGGSLTNINGVVVVNGLIDLAATGAMGANATGAFQVVAAGGIQSTIASGIEITAVGGLKTTAGAGSIALGTSSADIGFSATQSISRGQPPRVIGGLPTDWQPSPFEPYGISTSAVNSNAATLELGPLLDGQTLNSVTVYFIVGNNHSNLPQYFPSIDIRRQAMSSSGSYPSPQSLSSNGAQAATAATAAAWNATTNWTYTCNQYNVIDHHNYTYYIILTDEFGVNALDGNGYVNFLLNYSVTDMRIA